jgi:hypothetical protein
MHPWTVSHLLDPDRMTHDHEHWRQKICYANPNDKGQLQLSIIVHAEINEHMMRHDDESFTNAAATSCKITKKGDARRVPVRISPSLGCIFLCFRSISRLLYASACV